MKSNRRRLLGVLVLAAIGSACASIMGVEEPTLIVEGANPPTGPDASSPSDEDGALPPPPTPSDAGPTVCTPAPNDNCPTNNYCSPSSECTPGCKNDEECKVLSPSAPFCATDRHQCIECRDGKPDCLNGQVCSPSGSCVDRCFSDGGGCGASKLCCSLLCVDPKTDILNCNACTTACDKTVKHGVLVCTAGVCGYSACNAGFADCDGNRGNGCECDCGKIDQPCCPTGNQCQNGLACDKSTNKCKKPCAAIGASCAEGSDCCSGNCHPNKRCRE